MTFIEYAPGYRPEESVSDIEALCFWAYEISSTYTMPGDDIEKEKVPDDLIDPDDETAFLILLNPTTGGEKDEDEYDDDRKFLHQTQALEVNDKRALYLSNRPFLMDENGQLYPWTRPGFVALHIEPHNTPVGYIPPTYMVDQVIFRLPNSETGEEAAIFRGFEMIDKNRIDQDPDELEALEDVLSDFRDSTRKSMVTDVDFAHRTYFSQTPESTDAADYELSSLTD
jgi:hypothetical protein